MTARFPYLFWYVPLLKASHILTSAMVFGRETSRDWALVSMPIGRQNYALDDGCPRNSSADSGLQTLPVDDLVEIPSDVDEWREKRNGNGITP